MEQHYAQHMHSTDSFSGTHLNSQQQCMATKQTNQAFEVELTEGVLLESQILNQKARMRNKNTNTWGWEGQG